MLGLTGRECCNIINRLPCQDLLRLFMALAPPTGRELLIIAILLAFVIYPLIHETSSIPQAIPPAETTNRTHTSLPPLHTNEPSGSAITWGSSVPPETTVVAHVPGEPPPASFFPFSQNYQP